MAAFPRITASFLVFSTLTHIVCSGKLIRRDYSKWPKKWQDRNNWKGDVIIFAAPCKMYHRILDIGEKVYCPDVPAYVCASNNHSYKNECFFCVAQWEFGNISFKKYGKCD